MRRGTSGQGIIEENGVFVGFGLGADFTAEHEWGIKGLRRDLGMNSNKIGLERRTITVLPENRYRAYLKGKEPTLVFLSHRVWDSEDEKEVKKHIMKNHELSLYGDKDLMGAWSDSDFGIKVTAQYRKHLTELHEAFLRKDIAIFLGGGTGNPFENAGLMVVIASRVPEEGKKLLREGDLNYQALQKADDATGIKSKLYKAGKQYFALSPKWADFFKDPDYTHKTKHKVIYWLNPMEQHVNNSGYFTVEELELWADNKGPIPMKKKEKV